MTLEEAVETLPNGLHDAELLNLKVNYEKRTAEFEFNAWTGDVHAQNEDERERYERVSVRLLGLKYLVIEAPDPVYDFESGTPVVSGFSEWNGPASPLLQVSGQQGIIFYDKTFIRDWNSFLHVAAESAELKRSE